MSFDQNITYKVNVDDSDFQAKLTQLRSSMDMTMGGAGGFGGMGMGAMGSLMAGGGMMMGGNTGGMMRGLADFGSQVRPVTYTPPAIAMQPHFGMVSLQQSAGQSFTGSFGLPGIGFQSAMQFVGHPIQSLMNGVNDPVPNQMSYGEYANLSGRAFGTRLGDSAATASLAGASTLAGMASGGLGALAARGIFGTVAASAPWTEQLFSSAALGGMALSTAAMLPASMLTSAVGDMMAQNRGVQTQLEAGSFRFIGGGPDADPLTGRGFSRRARAEVADFVQTQELHDPRFGMEEMRGVLEGGMQLDLFSGTHDVAGFKQKFSGLVDSVKTIMSTLHTSLQEGLEVIRGFRDMGITDPGQISGMTMQAETMGRMSGMTGMEMLSVGQTGAEMFRGTGINMGLGFQTNMMNRTNVRELLNQGLVSRETIGQMGGENSAAQMMTAGALSSTQTALGRGLMMANFDPTTGGLRGDFGSRMTSGDMVGMLRDATSLRPQDILKFQANQEEMISSMSPMTLQTFEIGQITAQAKFLTKSLPGLTMDDAFVATGRMMGKSINEIKVMQGMLKEDPEKMRQNEEQAIESMAAQAAGEDMRNRFSLKGRVSNVIRGAIVQPIQRELTGMSTAIGESWDNMVMRLEGRNPVNLGSLGSSTITAARSATTNDMTGDVQDLRGSMWSRMVGQNTGAAVADMARFGTALTADQVGGGAGVLGGVSFMGGTAMKFKSEADVDSYAKRTGMSMMMLSSSNGEVLAISREEEKKVLERRSVLMPTKGDLDAVEKFQVSSDVGLRLEKLASAEAATSGGVTLKSLEGVLSKDSGFSKLSMAGKAAVLEREGQRFGLTAAVGKVQAGRGLAQGDVGALSATVSLGAAAASAEHLKSTIGTQLGFFEAGTRFGSKNDVLSTIDGMDFDALSIVSTTGDERDKAALNLRGILEKKGVSPDLINKVIATGEGEISKKLMSSDKLKLISADVQKVQQATAQGLSMQKSAGGAVAGGAGGASGDVGLLTKDTLNTMRTMSDALVKNMEILVRYQKEFNQLAGSK